MALSVRQQKAGSRPASGYPTTAKTVSAHPLPTRTDTLIHQPTLVAGPRALGQARGKRSKAKRRVLGPFGTKDATIIP